MGLIRYKIRYLYRLGLKKEIRNLGKYLHIFLGIIQGKKALTGPGWVSIELTHHCNLACEFCGSHGSRVQTKYPQARDYYRGQTTIEFNIYKALIDDLVSMGTTNVTFSGKGEPLIKKDICDYIEYAKSRGLTCKLITNGTLLTPSMIEQLINTGIDEVNISLNAGNEATYKEITGRDYFLNVTTATKTLVEKGKDREKALRVTMSHVICNKTFKDMPEMVELGGRLGVEEVSYFLCGTYRETDDLELNESQITEINDKLIPEVKRYDGRTGLKTNIETFANEINTATQSWKKINKIQTRIPCYAGWIFSVVAPDGMVFPCCYCREPLGNIYKKNFQEIWNSEKYAEFREMTKQLNKNPDYRMLNKCPCYTICNFWANNLTIFKFLHPFTRLRPQKLRRTEDED